LIRCRIKLSAVSGMAFFYLSRFRPMRVELCSRDVKLYIKIDSGGEDLLCPNDELVRSQGVSGDPGRDVRCVACGWAKPVFQRWLYLHCTATKLGTREDRSRSQGESCRNDSTCALCIPPNGRDARWEVAGFPHATN
jgi:hypothetical protein